MLKIIYRLLVITYIFIMSHLIIFFENSCNKSFVRLKMQQGLCNKLPILIRQEHFKSWAHYQLL